MPSFEKLDSEGIFFVVLPCQMPLLGWSSGLNFFHKSHTGKLNRKKKSKLKGFLNLKTDKFYTILSFALGPPKHSPEILLILYVSISKVYTDPVECNFEIQKSYWAVSPLP